MLKYIKNWGNLFIDCSNFNWMFMNIWALAKQRMCWKGIASQEECGTFHSVLWKYCE